MLTIVSNQNYDCFYIFVTSYGSLNLGEFLNYTSLGEVLAGLGLDIAVKESSTGSLSINNISVILKSFDFYWIELDDKLTSGEVNTLSLGKCKSDSIEFTSFEVDLFVEKLRTIQTNMLERKLRVSEIANNYRLNAYSNKDTNTRNSLLDTATSLSLIGDVLNLDTIGISHSIKLINQIKPL